MNRTGLRVASVLALAALLAPPAQAQLPDLLPVAAQQPAAPPAAGVTPPVAPAAAGVPAAPAGSPATIFGNSAPILAAGPEDDHGYFLAGVEYLLLQPLRRGTDYAVLGISPNTGPIGAVHNADGGLDSGFRVSTGYRFGSGGEVVFRYTNFHQSASDFVAATGGASVFPTLTDPALVTRVRAASAQSSVNLNVLDLEAGKSWQASDCLDLRAFVGPRLAWVDQTLLASYAGGNVRTDVTRSSTTFSGGGLRAGGEANYGLWGSLGLYGRGSASLLVGRFRTSLSETANTLPIVGVSDATTRVVPVVDVGLGLSYQGSCWRVTAGYEIINYFGMVDGLDVISDVHPGKLGRRIGDLGFNGLVLRAELQF